MVLNEILSDYFAHEHSDSIKILNILADIGYFKEHPNHRLAIRALIEKRVLQKLWDKTVSEVAKIQLYKDFIATTGFNVELSALIFSQISGFPYSSFDDKIHWHSNLTKDEMSKYILQNMTYRFDKRVIIKDVQCGVSSMHEFCIWFEFDKDSWNFNYDKENAGYFRSGKLNRVKTNAVSIDIWTRSGNHIHTYETHNKSSKVDFFWNEPYEVVETEFETNWIPTDRLSLGITIRHPIYDLSWIQIRHPS